MVSRVFGLTIRFDDSRFNDFRFKTLVVLLGATRVKHDTTAAIVTPGLKRVAGG